VITDAVMPGMNGWELCAAIRGRWPRLPVRMVSGHAHEVLERRRLVDQGLAFLEKPYTPEELVVKARSVIDAGTVPSITTERGSTR
jgi:two-component system cell cycle sensor histidine kinase/response regulator CckA